jgi:APA family basic amino acid/polyamine antiporter
LPKAIFLTLAISTLLYILVAWIALISVPHLELAAARAPLSLVFERVTGLSPTAISAIAVVATVNGVIAMMVTGARVIYGMADRKLLPSVLARVHARTRTPVLATALVAGCVVVLALAFHLEGLAEASSRLTLVIFTLVNAALVQLKRTGSAPAAGAFSVPMGVPLAGCALCLALLAGSLFG